MHTPIRRALFSLLALAAGCGETPPDGGSTSAARSDKQRVTPSVTAEDRAALAAGNGAFALGMYRELKKQAADNIVFSPASISTALAMTFAGARSDTESEISAALRFTLPQDRLHPAMNELDAALRARGEGKKGADGGPFTLRMVNTTWMQEGETFLPAYLDTLAEQYGAGVNLVDFIAAPEPARIAINQRVASDTEGKIKDLIPRGAIDGATRLVLTNAIYFNGAWRSPFTSTADGTFKRADGRTSSVKMMRLQESFRGVEGDGFVAVELPYEDERLSMLIVVPDEGKLAAFDDGLDEARLAAIVGSLKPRNVSLTLPRFKFELPADLKKALTALGMVKAFEGGAADFSGMDGTRELYIQAVLHKAFIAVGEKGTEAAAATAVIVGRTSLPTDLLIVNADRPFLFFLRDQPTGAILFMGRVMDPALISGG